MRDLKPNEKDLLARVISNPDIQPFFFRKVRGLHWYNALSEYGFLAPEKNPRPHPAKEEGYVNIPYWPVTEYLVVTSDELNVSSNEEYAIKFIELIRSVTEYAKREGFSNYRTWWQFAKVIRNVPHPLIRNEDIELIDYWMDDPFERGLLSEELGEKWLPSLIENENDHSRQLASHLLASLYKVVLSAKGEPRLRFDAYHAGKLSSKNVLTLSGKKLGLIAVEILERQLVTILVNGDNDSWSCIWRKAIEEHEQNGSINGTDDVIVAAYRDCLLGFVDGNAEAAKTYLRSLLNGKYQTLKRVAIHVLDRRFIDLKELYDIVIASQYFHDNYRYELWHLLNNHFAEMAEDDQKRVVDIIEKIVVSDEDEKENEKATAYKRSIWLSAIKNYGDKINRLYAKYTSITAVEPDHPDLSSYMTSGWVDHKSPVPIETLLSLDNKTLAETINGYRDSGRSRFDEPGIEGLAKSFKEVVKTRAGEIYRELKLYTESDLAFVYVLLGAYRDLWRDNKELPWNDVWPHLLDFCLILVKKDQFWSDESSRERPSFVANRHSIVGEFGSLIEDGTKTDDHAFDRSLLPIAKEILLIMLGRQRGEVFKLDSDAVLVAINSPRGKCLEALINMTLRSCRLENKELGNHDNVWKDYKAIYDAELRGGSRGEYEFVTLAAMYLPNIGYMSHEWLQTHLSSIFDKSDYKGWLCAMQGYIHVGVVYETYYSYLKTSGDLLKALDDDNLKKQVTERIIQNIVVAYINNFEDLTQQDSLILALLRRNRIDELQQLVWFIWTLRDKTDGKLREKIYELWPRLLELIDVNVKEGRLLASSLCHWAAFVSRIDPTVESWLLKIAPYADENHNASDLLRSLAELSNAQPLEVQKIWIKMLESASYDYPEDAFRQIFKNLVDLGGDGVRKAREVVDAYIRHGLERPKIWLDEAISSRG